MFISFLFEKTSVEIFVFPSGVQSIRTGCLHVMNKIFSKICFEIYRKYFLDKIQKTKAIELSFSRVLVGHADMQRVHSGAQSAAGEPKVCATQWTKKPVFVEIRTTLSMSFGP